MIVANELLDALPTHAVTMTSDGLKEVYVDADGGRFVERTGPPSSPALARYFDRLGNGEFSARLVSWVARQDDLISAMRPVRGVPRLVLTEDDRGQYIRNAIVFPAVAAFALLLLTLRRSRTG